jgi:hypothetical protein
VEALEEEHGRGWVAHWLREQGLPEWARRFEGLEEAAHTEPAEANLKTASLRAGREEGGR